MKIKLTQQETNKKWLIVGDLYLPNYYILYVLIKPDDIINCGTDALATIIRNQVV